MAKFRINSGFLFGVIVLISLPMAVMGLDRQYDRTTCLNETTTRLKNDPEFVSRNPNLFFRGSTLANPLLTLQGCRVLCAERWGVYRNPGQRLVEWIFPALLLIANMHFAPIGKKRYSIVVHLLGDPCDTLFRLLSTIEDWRETFLNSCEFIRDQEKRHGESVEQVRMQPQIITEVKSAATTKLIEFLDTHEFSDQLYNKLDMGRVPLQELKKNYSAFRKAARALRRQRLHNLRRTGIAILVYICQVIGVFLPQLGAISPSGGMISPSMLLAWLLPTVMLSNIGDYASWEIARETLLEFLNDIEVDLQDLLDAKITKDLEGAKLAIIPARLSEVACSGAIMHSQSNNRHRSRLRTAVLIFISVLPVTLACAGAFASDYTAPTYFSCRATSILAFYVAWISSPIMTRLILRYKTSIGRRVWAFILIKDFTIATPILTLILISTCGLYNSCYCASGYIVRGSEARVDLDPTRFYSRNNNMIYPGSVSTTLALETLIPLLVYGIQYQGFQAIWWTESRKHVEAVMENSLDTPDELDSENKLGSEERRRIEQE